MAQSHSKKRPTARSSSPAKASQQKGSFAQKKSNPLSQLFARRTSKKVASATASQTKQAPFNVPSPDAKRAARQRGQEMPQHKLPSLRFLAIGAAVAVILAVVAALTLTALSHTSLFTIESVIVTSSEHVSEDSLMRLARPEDNATLLNIDTDALRESIMRNPWVAEVHIHRAFPSTLRISVTERRVKALVVMNSGEIVWCLGDGDVWIEPIQIDVADGQDFSEAALAAAQEMGAVLIKDVPASVSPEAAQATTDEAILAVSTYIEQFSETFSDQIVSYSAPSAASVSCVLSSGVKISLGEANSISSKETVVTQLLEEYTGQITYINVRVPSNPSYRTIDSPSVQEGTGALGVSGVDPEAAQESEERAESGLPEDGEGRFQTYTSSGDEDDYYDDEYYDEWY